MYLYHYYDKSIGPFMNLSDIPIDEAKKVLNEFKQNKPNVQCAGRHVEYMETRLYYEELIRNLFIKKGGSVTRNAPHYMVVEHSHGFLHGMRIVHILKFLLKNLI